MRSRPYADADLPALLAAFAAWIAEAGRCGYDHPGELPHRIYGPAPRLVRLWEKGDAIAGVAIGLRFGCAFDVFAAPSLRGGDAERELLRAAARATGEAMDPAEPFVLTDAFDCDTPRIELLTELGFERFRTWDDLLEVELGARIAVAEPPHGFVLRTARPTDADGLAFARNDAFGEGWTGARYRSEVMEKPGYDPERELVVESPDGRIAAFAVYWLDERNRLGHLEPVGTLREFRHRGLARAATLHALARMRELGMSTATVGHDAENVPARSLYRSLGFRRVYRTSGFRRPRRP